MTGEETRCSSHPEFCCEPPAAVPSVLLRPLPMGQPMHLADFLGLAAAHPELHRQLGTLPPLPPDARHCLLCGPERSGKTALLFHLALCLARQGQHVLLLCRR